MILILTKIHRKTPVPESPFNKVAGLRPANLLKRDSGTDKKLDPCKTSGINIGREVGH